ncbi:MAG: efflux transporter outer membrane subunit [Proteobacteria bacterium]|nr:efflux transporter outer membrane subunit [Pseudomonadota bacterium]
MPLKANTKIYPFIVLCSLTGGCTVGPDYIAPNAPSALTYTEDPQPEQTVQSKGPGGNGQYFYLTQKIPEQWWALFHSEALNQLIFKGYQQNPSIEAAMAALRQAQENYRAQVGDYFPSFDLQLSAQRQQATDASIDLPVREPFIYNVFNSQVNVSYTLDLFGANRRALEGLCAQVYYQGYQLEGAYLTLTSNIVTTAITEASIYAQVQATHELIKLEEDLLQIIQQQYQLGGVAKNDVLSQESQLAQTRATLPPLEKNLALTRHSLAALVGEIPSQSPIPSFCLDDLVLPSDLPVTLPSTLVQQRPDIRAQEALLRAASAQIGVATANIFPNITISGYSGWLSNQLNTLYSPKSFIWSISSQLLQPIFHGGTLLAQRRAAIAAFEQARAQYKETVINAFKNVADALRAIELDAKALAAQTEALDAAKKLYDLSRQQYKLGAITYLSLLNAQRQYNLALINKIQAQALRYTDTAALFQALGGLWWPCQPIGETPYG